MSAAFCADDAHEFGPAQLVTAPAGPMEGEWLIECCQVCSTFSLRPADGGDAIGPLLAALERAGCDPQPIGPEGR